MRQQLLHSLFLFSCFVFFNGCATDETVDNPTPFQVTGIVTSDLGQPLSGVLVNSVVDTVFTDPNGQYTINSYPTGAIEYTSPGFAKWIESVNQRKVINVTLIKIPDGNDTRFDIKLVQKQCENGGSINVTVVEIKDFGEGTGTMTWTKDKVWVLKNKVFVNDGQTLTIEPGTIIKGGAGQAETTCALIVSRGGKIIANGTPDLPIIFTSESDELVRDQSGTICKSTTLTKADKGLWGGLMLCGKAVLNSDPGESQIEGIPEDEPRALYGGNNDDDSSGSLSYLSIRHSGTEITINKEVNGLTLAGVGSGTDIHHIEVFGCSDDGFEFFGGRVNTRYLVSAYNGDDAFDYDEGWRGLNQYWLAVQDTDADRGGEHDGGTDPQTGTPYATPVIYNATLKGSATDTGKRAITFRENAGGEYHNSIFMTYALGVDIQYLGPGEQDCYKMLQNQYLAFKNNILFDIAAAPVFTLDNKSTLPNNDPAVQFVAQDLQNYFNTNNNATVNPDLDNSFVPNIGGPAAQPGSTPSNPFFETTNFKGCFAPGAARWIAGWTRSDQEF